jgi:predicted lysophospholipase L1 biosynthesis ABC-type transport system permease subunit
VASDTAGAPRVAIVSRALAARLWPNADPIGRRLVSTESVEVVGVAPDTVYLSATERDPRPFFYVPLAQQYESGLALHVRATGDPLALVPAVRDATRRLDPQIAVARPRRLIDDFDRSLQAERTLATFVSVLSGMALLLAGVGIYGVMAHATRQRTPEIGLRLALGATPGSILGLMLTQGARLVAIGCGLGLTGAFFGARLIRARLFGIEPGDAVTWLGVSLVLLLVTLAACAIPARRAMRTDPASTLRGS